MSDIQKEILDEIKRLHINCPACASMGDDDQYTCTTCWCEGGNGTIRVFDWIRENWENIKDGK